MTFAPVGLPSGEPRLEPDEVDRQIHRWVASPPMRALVAASGVRSMRRLHEALGQPIG